VAGVRHFFSGFFLGVFPASPKFDEHREISSFSVKIAKRPAKFDEILLKVRQYSVRTLTTSKIENSLFFPQI